MTDRTNRPHIFRTPLLILLALVITITLLFRGGLHFWAAHKKSVSAIPQRGTFICDELSMTISFGNHTIITLPDGTAKEAVIDYGNRIQAGNDISGWYEAHLEVGYIEIQFTKLSVFFDPVRSYQFWEDK